MAMLFEAGNFRMYGDASSERGFYKGTAMISHLSQTSSLIYAYGFAEVTQQLVGYQHDDILNGSNICAVDAVGDWSGLPTVDLGRRNAADWICELGNSHVPRAGVMHFSGHWLRDGSLRVTHLQGGVFFPEEKRRCSKWQGIGLIYTISIALYLCFLNQGLASSARFGIYYTTVCFL